MTGFEAKFVDAGGGSDGNRIAKAGIPVIDAAVRPVRASIQSVNTCDWTRWEERVKMLTNFFRPALRRPPI